MYNYIIILGLTSHFRDDVVNLEPEGSESKLVTPKPPPAGRAIPGGAAAAGWRPKVVEESDRIVAEEGGAEGFGGGCMDGWRDGKQRAASPSDAQRMPTARHLPTCILLKLDPCAWQYF